MDRTCAKDLIVEAVDADPCLLALITAPTATQFEALSALVGSMDPAPALITAQLELDEGASWTEVAESILIGPVLWRSSFDGQQPSRVDSSADAEGT